MLSTWLAVAILHAATGPDVPEPTAPPSPRALRAPAPAGMGEALLESVFHPCSPELSWAEGVRRDLTCPELKPVRALLRRVLRTEAGLVPAARRLDELRRARAVHVEPDFTYTPCLARPESKLTLTVFLDFDCGFCRGLRFRLYDLVKHYPVRVCVKQFPTGILERFPTGALASLAAWRQDAWLPMFEALYRRGGDLDEAAAIRLATDLGLAVQRFGADLESPEVQAILLRDAAEGGRLGVQGTPTVVVSGDDGDELFTDFEVLEDWVATRLCAQSGGPAGP
jgi:hypothetical protein